MPEPLSKIAETNRVDFKLGKVGQYPFDKHPELTRWCMEAIASWSQVEACALQLFVTLLGQPSATAAMIYLELDGKGPKSAALKVVAERTLPSEFQEVFGAIRKLIASQQKHRDKLAHGVWGYSPDVSDGLLLISPKELPLQYHPREMGDFFNNIYLHADKIFVYREQDFSGFVRDNENLADAMLAFRRAFIWRDTHQAAERFARLCDMPGIRGTVRRPA